VILRAQHTAGLLPLCIKGHARSEQVAEQLADDFTAKEHPNASTAPPHHISELPPIFKRISND
jgi:hypothetical protein